MGDTSLMNGRKAEGLVSSTTSWYLTLLKVSAKNSRNTKRVPHKHKRRLTVRRLLLFLAALVEELLRALCDRLCEFGASFCERRTLVCRALLILQHPEQREGVMPMLATWSLCTLQACECLTPWIWVWCWGFCQRKFARCHCVTHRRRGYAMLP